MNQVKQDPVPIPLLALEKEVLEGIIQDFILREGTDYGTLELSYEEKANQVMEQLRAGRAQIYFDPGTETCTILLV